MVQLPQGVKINNFTKRNQKKEPLRYKEATATEFLKSDRIKRPLDLAEKLTSIFTKESKRKAAKSKPKRDRKSNRFVPLAGAVAKDVSFQATSTPSNSVLYDSLEAMRVEEVQKSILSKKFTRNTIMNTDRKVLQGKMKAVKIKSESDVQYRMEQTAIDNDVILIEDNAFNISPISQYPENQLIPQSASKRKTARNREKLRIGMRMNGKLDKTSKKPVLPRIMVGEMLGKTQSKAKSENSPKTKKPVVKKTDRVATTNVFTTFGKDPIDMLGEPKFLLIARRIR